MGCEADVMAFLREPANDVMAITILGPVKHYKKRVPSRIPISVYDPHEKERDRDSNSERSMQRDKEIERSAYPRRSESEWAYRQIDVRYLTKLRDRFMSSYSCNQRECPMIKDRLEHHHMEKHRGHGSGQHNKTIASSVNVTKQLISTKSGPDIENAQSFEISIQDLDNTDANDFHPHNKSNKTYKSNRSNDFNNNYSKLKNFDDNDTRYHVQSTKENRNYGTNHLKPNSFKNNLQFPYQYERKESDDDLSLKRTKTRELLTPKRNIYKDYVQKNVKDWFQEVPIYPNIEERNNINKDDIANNLTDEITSLSNEYNKEYYEWKVKCVIDQFLNRTPIWLPGAKREQEKFKNKLIDNLLQRIRDLNKRFLDSNANQKKSVSEKNMPPYNYEIEEEIENWLESIKLRRHSRSQMAVDKRKLSQALIQRLVPMLNKSKNTCHFRLNLKSAIIEVLNCFSVENKNLQLHKLIHELANRIIITTQTKIDNHRNSFSQQPAMCYNNYVSFNKNAIKDEIDECLRDTLFVHHNKVKSEITDMLVEYLQFPYYPYKDFDIEKDILNILKKTANISTSLALRVCKNILRSIKGTLNKSDRVSYSNPSVYKTISVFTSQETNFPIYPVTSTPKKIKSPPRLNNEEIHYSGKVADLIRAWMETLPVQLNTPEELEFKETAINDLAGNLTDVVKLQQLTSIGDKENWLTYTVYKWINKINLFDLTEVTSQIKEFVRQLGDIPVPVLTRPQHGNRQALANIKHVEGELGFVNDFLPKAEDVLEDGISIWMNQQSSDIFDIDKTTRGNKIHELAEVLKDKLNDKRPDSEISRDVVTWLTDLMKPDQHKKINMLAENLKDKVIKLPHDATLAAYVEKKKQERLERINEKKRAQPIFIFTTTNAETVERDNTMQQYISKFIEHHYDTDDILARGAFNKLLKSKLQFLNPPTRKEIYDSFGKFEPNISHEMLLKELDYIKIVSDWLKNIPVEVGYNTAGNRQRVDFVIDMARNILEVEQEREANPETMDYNLYLASIICQCLINLPIIEEHKSDDFIKYMIEVLLGKIISQRRPQYLNNTSGIHNENIGDFVEEFIRINGSEIANDELKLEAWSVRLIQEIKKMVNENEDPETLSKAKVYDRLANISMPGDESIKQFENEFEYIKEISQWIKNLPLLPIDQSLEKERIKLICELTEKLAKRDIQKSNNPVDNKADAEFNEYISKWITDLSLDESHEVVVAVVIQQLLNRIDGVKARQENNTSDITHAYKTSTTKDSKDCCKSNRAKKSKQIKDPANIIVKSIEKWSESLPINLDDKKVVKSIRDDVTKKLFQKVGELSINPRTYNDDLLYQNLLVDEVDAIIEQLPQSTELEKSKEQFITEFVENIVEAQRALKDNNAGEYYKQKLMHSIEASIPHPVSSKKAYNPGFEIYKTRLADMFILENFDHGCDSVKMKFERRIRDEIDKYYENVKNKSAIPLTNDEIYNELYGALFKVPIPRESSVMGEVEEIKTRCIIDDWFDELPLTEASLNELLDRDLTLATLAKRILELEKNEKKPADKIHKEIMKWLVKLPFSPGHENSIEKYAKTLEDVLKSSTDTRKCIITEAKFKKGKKSKSKSIIQDHRSCSNTNMLEHQPTPVKPKKKAAEMLIKIVEDWCSHIPIKAAEEDTVKNIKENLATKIIIKISELNMNPTTFDNDFQYGLQLDEELEQLLGAVPVCCNFKESKKIKKLQLKDAVESIKPLFKEERANQQYKVDLCNTVAQVLDEPKDEPEDTETLFNILKDDIIENFIQYNYENNYDEDRQAYKMNIHEAVVEFLNATESKDSMDPLMKRNQLLCELAKIRIPSEDGFKDYVEEVRMKNEISKLFDNLSISKNKQTNHIKSILAKKLNEMELNGHGPAKYENMKLEIMKSLKKLNKDPKPDIIDKTIEGLKINEMIRRAPRNNKAENAKTCCNVQNYNQNTQKPDNIPQKRSIDAPSRQELHITSKLECECAITDQIRLSSAAEHSVKVNTRSKSKIECECSKTNIAVAQRPLNEHYQNHSRKNDARQISPSKVECDYPKAMFAQNERPLSPDTETDDRDSFTDTNTCRECRRRRIRTCFMRRRWCGPEDLLDCRMPAFFYY